MMKRVLDEFECSIAASKMMKSIITEKGESPVCLYGIPRGGIPVSHLCLRHSQRLVVGITYNPHQATVFVDDVEDSGLTKMRYLSKFPNIPFYSLANYLSDSKKPGEWLVFPWERDEDSLDTSGEDVVVRLLQYIGEDPERGGLKETPQRVMKAWKEWTSGYDVDVRGLFKTFEDGGKEYNQMVVVKDLPFYSHCEHHLASFFGTATIAYIPDKKIVGLSKLGRVLGAYSKRLQVQERLTNQVADAIWNNLQPKGVGVVIKARHLCMESRGLSQQGHHTITSALYGEFEKAEVRAEFLSLAR